MIGSLKWVMGSATPKNNNPIPIPAAKSIEIQEKYEYSGLESFRPNRIFPDLLHAKQIKKIKKTETLPIKNQLMSLKIRFLIKFKHESVFTGMIPETILRPIIINKDGIVILKFRVVLFIIYILLSTFLVFCANSFFLSPFLPCCFSKKGFSHCTIILNNAKHLYFYR